MILLLVHGWGSDQRVWDRLRAEMGSTWVTVAPNLRGHGTASNSPGPYTIDAMAADLAALVDTLEEPVVAIGHSMGGNVSVQLALLRPNRLAGVVAIEPAYADPGHANAPARAAALSERGSVAATDDLATAFGPAVPPRVIEQVRSTLLATRPEVLIAGLRSTYLDDRAFGHLPDTRRRLAELATPLLSVYARPQVATAAAELPVAAHRIVTVADSGHFIPLEQPEQLWAVVEPWLRARSGPGS